MLLTVLLVLLGIGLSFYGFIRIEKRIRQHQEFINQAMSEIERANTQITGKTSEALESIIFKADSQITLMSDLSERLETFASKTLAQDFFMGKMPIPDGLMEELKDVQSELHDATERRETNRKLAGAILYGNTLVDIPKKGAEAK